MRNFTKYRKILLLTVLALGVGLINLDAQADNLQSHTLEVASPGSVAGNYQLLIATFGPTFCETDDVMGELILATNDEGGSLACDTITNDLSGKIAIIDRGSCGFSNKVFMAQQKGAIAVIICDANAGQDYVSMSGTDFIDDITIPSFFMLKADCDILKTALGDTIQVNINRNDLIDDFDGDVIYQEDFAGGLNDWTVVVESCTGVSVTDGLELWKWKAEGLIDGSCTSGTIFSPTRCNGAIVFESDFQDNDGTGCGGAAVGSGSCPSPHTGVLTSPSIDLSNSNAGGYSIRFRQFTRTFRSSYYVGWSYDGGTTWDSVEVNATLAVNAFNEPEDDVVKIPMPGSLDASNVTVRFRYESDYYFWAIDDVQIIAQESNNMQVNDNWYAVPPNLITPISQVEPIGFLADIENVGAGQQSNVTLNVSVVDTNLASVFSADLAYNDVPANTLVENVPFSETFTPTQQGTYLGIYTISSDADDADESNNVVGFPFLIGDNLFAKEVGATRTILPAQSEWDVNEPHSWAYGNYFYVPNGAGNFVDEVSFALGNPADVAGLGLVISLYEWTEDTNNDGNMDPNERVSTAFSFYIIDGTETPGAIISVPFPGEGEDPVALKDETSYVLALEYLANDNTDLALTAADDVDYGASVLVSQLLGAPRYASMLAINGDLSTEPFSSTGFGRNFIPVVRMTIKGEATSTKDKKDINNEFTVYPNPASELINVQLVFQDQAEQADIRILDVSGKTILQRSYDNVQREFFEYNVSKLPTGTGTKRFVVTQK